MNGKIYVCGHGVLSGDGWEDTSLFIGDDLQAQKTMTIETIREVMERIESDHDGETLFDHTTIFFIVEQTPNSALTHIDLEGGTRGEITLNGDHTKLFMFSDWGDPTMDMFQDAISQVEAL